MSFMRFDWNDNEFEELLQREANQHRMYPSDKVWRNIHSELHGHKRWHSLYISAFLIITALAVATFLNNKPVYLQKLLSENGHAVVNTKSEAKATKDYFKLNSAETINEQTFNRISDLTESINEAEYILALADNKLISLPQEPIQLVSTPAIDLTPTINIPSPAVNTVDEDINAQKSAVESSLINKITTEAKPIVEEIENLTNHTKDFGFNVSYKAMKKNKWSFQYFIVPSISYRKLNDQIVQDLSPMFTSNNPIAAAAPSTSNTLIRNRPGMGIEAGIAFMYNVSNRIRLKVGLQYNLRQYYIETYQSSNDFANILLMENNRVQQNLRVSSRFNNTSGFLETEINNRIGQISVPLGIQWDILKTKTVNFTAEATIQPSFTTSKNVYLLSTDYTNYVDGTNLMRRSNINTSVGFFASFPVGKNTIWQIGPQYRYQHLPTYINKYPIKENLHDFGIRLGVIKSLGK